MNSGSEAPSMLADLIVQLIFVAVVCGLLLLMLMASDQNNRAMLRFWEAVLGMVIILYLT
jgi:hypothetical protein